MNEMSVLKTLRRVPDRIILATMGRDLELSEGNACLCGWFVREKLAEMRDVAEVESAYEPPETDYYSPADSCVDLFGGDAALWYSIYNGVGDGDDWRYPIIERAFVRRVDEAVNPRRRPTRKARV
jgi:hypothetical protein